MALTAKGYLRLAEFDKHFDRAEYRFVPVFSDTSKQECRLQDFPGLPGLAVLPLPSHRAAIFVVFPTQTVFHAIPRREPGQTETKYYFADAVGQAEATGAFADAVGQTKSDPSRTTSPGDGTETEQAATRREQKATGTAPPRAAPRETDRRGSDASPAKVFTILDDDDEDCDWA
jgi:hypothetical protein